MIRLSASIRSKADWWIKYRNPEIRAKWRAEALDTKMVWQEELSIMESLESAIERVEEGKELDKDSIVQLNEKQVDYVLDELARYDELRDERNGVQVRTVMF